MSGKEKTVCVIGAILFCLVVHEPIVTLLCILAGLLPQVVKVLELSANADDPEFRNKYN